MKTTGIDFLTMAANQVDSEHQANGLSATLAANHALDGDPVDEKKNAAERYSLSAHTRSAEAEANDTPENHLQAAQSHLGAHISHAGLASYLHSNGRKNEAEAANSKAASHKSMAHSHTEKALKHLK